jgi:DNA-binding transcriptional LysR family regulator
MVTLKQLEAIYWIAKLGSFEKAAQKLSTTQSAVSKRIQELEDSFQQPLFDRTNRTARLTEKGEELFELCNGILGERDRIIEALSTKEALVRRLRFGATDLTILTWFPRLVQKIRQTFPKVLIEPEVAASTELFESLLDDALDFIIAPVAQEDDRLAKVILGEVDFAWMCSPSIAPPGARMALADIAKHPVLLQPDSAVSGRIMNKWFRAQEVEFRQKMSSNNLTLIAGLAVSGMGFAYLPKSCFRSLLDEGRLSVIDSSPPLPSIQYAAFYKPDRATAFNAAIIEIARSVCDFSTPFQIQSFDHS